MLRFVAAGTCVLWSWGFDPGCGLPDVCIVVVVVVHVLEVSRFVQVVDLVYVRLRLGVVQDGGFLPLGPRWFLCDYK